MAAVDTPLKCPGIPSISSAATINIDDEFVISKAYWCTKGHNFNVDFAAPIDLPVFWECNEHGIVAFEC
ncbi:MAG: RNA polymerase-binding protein RbpA [Enterococcus sp.]|nr:RNA polymerase-binding protein RbpA [Enterococcus sp.]